MDNARTFSYTRSASDAEGTVMTDASSMLGTSSPPAYSRDELMSRLGLAPDEIDALLTHSKGSEIMRATLSTISNHLRSIYDLNQDRIVGFLKRHHDTFDGPPLGIMLRDMDGADRVERYLAAEVYSTW